MPQETDMPQKGPKITGSTTYVVTFHLFASFIPAFASENLKKSSCSGWGESHQRCKGDDTNSWKALAANANPDGADRLESAGLCRPLGWSG